MSGDKIIGAILLIYTLLVVYGIARYRSVGRRGRGRCGKTAHATKAN